jgi:hypothetical protein
MIFSLPRYTSFSFLRLNDHKFFVGRNSQFVMAGLVLVQINMMAHMLHMGALVKRLLHGKTVTLIRGKRSAEYMSRKNWPGPMVERKTEKQMERRTAKIAMRVAREGAITRGWVMGVVEIMRRGFFGRMKWLIKGV